jgi:pimeloyl-ACP methyl ester carboxylesterase
MAGSAAAAMRCGCLPWGFDLGAIGVPVQIWRGLRDASVQSAHGRWLAERVPGCRRPLPEADDHATIAAGHASQAYDWLIAQATAANA